MVVSALGGVTDELIAISALAAFMKGEKKSVALPADFAAFREFLLTA